MIALFNPIQHESTASNIDKQSASRKISKNSVLAGYNALTRYKQHFLDKLHRMFSPMFCSNYVIHNMNRVRDIFYKIKVYARLFQMAACSKQSGFAKYGKSCLPNIVSNSKSTGCIRFLLGSR